MFHTSRRWDAGERPSTKNVRTYQIDNVSGEVIRSYLVRKHPDSVWMLDVDADDSSLLTSTRELVYQVKAFTVGYIAGYNSKYGEYKEGRGEWRSLEKVEEKSA